MLLTLTCTHAPATDFGFLLAKRPGRLQRWDLPFGSASFFYTEATPERCTAALLLDIDPVGLVRGRAGADGGGPLSQYVNDRPYAASSFLSVALARVLRSAMAGACKDRPALADTPLPLQAHVPVLRCHGGPERIRACFEPLGYQVQAQPLPLDDGLADGAPSPYVDLRLSAQVRLADLLNHLYVLLPALDGDKHYYVGHDEVDKLLDKAGSWLAAHPEREWIASRYLKRQHALVRAALARLLDDDQDQLDTAQAQQDQAEQRIERPLSLNEQRQNAVLHVLQASGARRVLDLGCGEGRLLARLMQDKQFEQITGADVSLRALDIAQQRLRLDRLPERQRQRVQLLQSALTYRDQRLQGFDAACVVEVIEHIDPGRLPAFEQALFAHARPATVVVTTPNAEYNVRFDTLTPGRLRHDDHRFEWTRAEFAHWASAVAARHGYAVRQLPVGEPDPDLGPPTQMAVFERA